MSGFFGGGGGGGGSGTVTSVSVATANGVSGVVANPTTTPAITLTLGAITPSTVNLLTITKPATGATLTIVDGKTLTVDNSLELAGADGTKMTFPGASDTVAGLGTANIFSVAQTISAAGTLSAPALVFSNAGSNTGILAPASGQLQISALGAGILNYGVSTAGTWTVGPNVFANGNIRLTANSGQYTLRNGTTIIGSSATAVLQLGGGDAASAVAQTLGVQGVLAGNANTAGATFTIAGSKSNGSGGGDVVIQTTNTNAASGTQNTLATALTLKAGTPAGNAGDTVAAGFLQSAGFKQVTSQFDKTGDTALANITGLSVTLIAAGVYALRAVLFVTSDAVGGQKYAISGTCTATAIIYEVQTVSNSANTIVISSKQTALGGSVGQAGSTDDFTTIEGLITVNAAGTLTVQFAQNASNGTSSVLVGSFMLVNRIA